MLLQTRRLQLKAQTARVHEAVEVAIGPLETPADYRRYLHAIFCFRIPFETEMQSRPWPQAFGDWRPVLIGQALAQDAADLGIDPMLHVGSPDSFDLARSLGMLYVLEGSALGAHLIYAKAKLLGLHATFGARHLAQQTASPGSWHRFLQVLEHTDPIALDTVILSAQATFAAVERAFNKA